MVAFFDQVMESSDDEKNKQKIISLFDGLRKELGIAKKMENEYNKFVKTMTSGYPKEVPTEMENMMKEKDSEICQLNMKIKYCYNYIQ